MLSLAREEISDEWGTRIMYSAGSAKRFYVCLLSLLGWTAALAETRIALQAADIELPRPWMFDNTSGDSPGGAWVAPWQLQWSVSATVSLGQTLAPGTYSVYFKTLDYDRGNTASFTLGDATSITQTLDDRDPATGYWSTNVSVTTTSSTDTIIVDFVRAAKSARAAPRLQNLRWSAVYITSDTNEVVLRDDRILALHYPTVADNDDSPAVKGNHVPNSSFECGIGPFWRVIHIGRTETLRDLWSTNFAWHGTHSLRLPCPTNNGQYAVQSNPLTLASNKIHTVSVYARSAFSNNWASLYLTSLYSAPAGFAPSYSTNVGQAVGPGWKRLSVTTTNLPFYPNGQYYILHRVGGTAD
jgi:hypothetical protein